MECPLNADNGPVTDEVWSWWIVVRSDCFTGELSWSWRCCWLSATGVTGGGAGGVLLLLDWWLVLLMDMTGGSGRGTWTVTELPGGPSEAGRGTGRDKNDRSGPTALMFWRVGDDLGGGECGETPEPPVSRTRSGSVNSGRGFGGGAGEQGLVVRGVEVERQGGHTGLS